MWERKEDILEMYCKYDKLTWICRACEKLIQSDIPGNTQFCQRQALPKVDNQGSVELGDPVRDILLEAAEGENNQSRDKEERVAPK